MPTTEYIRPRTCACGYTTIGISNWCQHKKHCRLLSNNKDALSSGDKQVIDTLKEQLLVKDQHYQRELAAKDEQIRAKDEHIKTQSDEIKALSDDIKHLLEESCAELKVEVQLLRKRKQPPVRVHRTELQRRQIAKRQNWICAGKECTLKGHELQEYDVDHIIPLSLGGSEEDDNLQALCPGCHRKKTDQERIVSTNDVCKI